MRALVTGGAGFIGSHLVDALLARGAEVRVLDNLLPQAHRSGRPVNVAAAAELCVADLRDRDAVEAALHGVDTVFHLGGIVGNGQSMLDVRRYADINVVGTATLLEAMIGRRAQFRRLVVASSMVVYGDGAYACPQHGALSVPVEREVARLTRGQWEPTCPLCGAEVSARPTDESQPLRPTSVYGVNKRDQEELALVVGRAHELPTIALRYLNTYGSRQALSNPYTGVCALMITRMLAGRRPTIFEDGAQVRDPTHVSDIVRATLAAADAGEGALYRAINVGRGEPVSVVAMARALARTLGRDIEPHITGEFRAGDIRHCYADVHLAKTLLHWSAQVSFEEGARELAEWAAHQAPDDLTDAANDELRQKGLIR